MTTPQAPLPDVIRYGLEWTGPKDFVCKPMPDGYWTPWHIANAHIAAQAETIAALEASNKRLRDAMNTIIQGGLPRGIERKVDTCKHGKYGWEDCENCVSEYLQAALAQEGK